MGIKDARSTAAWRKYDPETVMAVWLLYSGGITDPDVIRELMGLDVHKNTIMSMVAGGRHITAGPIVLEYAVRCKSCGTAIITIPCRTCEKFLQNPGRFGEVSRPTDM